MLITEICILLLLLVSRFVSPAQYHERTRKPVHLLKYKNKNDWEGLRKFSYETDDGTLRQETVVIKSLRIPRNRKIYKGYNVQSSQKFARYPGSTKAHRSAHPAHEPVSRSLHSRQPIISKGALMSIIGIHGDSEPKKKPTFMTRNKKEKK